MTLLCLPIPTTTQLFTLISFLAPITVTSNPFYKPVNDFKTNNHYNYHRTTHLSPTFNKTISSTSTDDLENLFYNTHGSALFYYENFSED